MCIISSNNHVCTVICVVQAVRVNSDPIAIEDGLKQQHQQKRKRDKRQDEMSKPGGQKLLRESTGTEACPLFYPFFTGTVMEDLIKQLFIVELA